jgi:hypothetical protein
VADALTFKGELRVTPQVGNPSGDATVDELVDESLVVEDSVMQKFSLLSDSQAIVSFGALASARMVQIKVVGGPVQAALSFGLVADQIISVDSLAVLFSEAAPYTGLKLTRAPGKDTAVRLFLAG